ncbi:MAG: hypothetical protein ACLGG5_09005 [Thermoleophilia bacterium]
MSAPRRPALALAAVLVALLCLGGCGGSSGDSSPTTSATATAATTATTTGAPQGEGEAKAKPKPPPVPRNPPRQSAPEGQPQPGAKAVAPGVPTTKGGDNSIQAFGAEGEEDQRAQAYEALRSYLAALGSGEFAKACALASSQLRAELEKLLEGAKVPPGQEKPQGCAGVLKTLLGGASEKALGPLTEVGELLSFRTEGDYAYLIFRGAQGKAMFIAMADEDGKWRVNVPRPEAFQGAGQEEGSAQ